MTEEKKQILKDAGIDVEGALNRFLNNEDLYMKFLMKFPEDKSFWNFCQAMQDSNCEYALKYAHTLKGLSGNLSIMTLYDLLYPCVNDLRAGNMDNVKKLQPDIETAYQITMKTIAQITE